MNIAVTLRHQILDRFAYQFSRIVPKQLLGFDVCHRYQTGRVNHQNCSRRRFQLGRSIANIFFQITLRIAHLDSHGVKGFQERADFIVSIRFQRWRVISPADCRGRCGERFERLGDVAT